MTIGIAKFSEFQKSQRDMQEAQRWVAHIGAKGREGDVLALSPAHSSIKLTVAGQYTAGGNNYWESPAPLNSAILRAIIQKRSEILSDALALMKADENAKLVAAKDEIASISAAIEQAAA